MRTATSLSLTAGGMLREGAVRTVADMTIHESGLPHSAPTHPISRLQPKPHRTRRGLWAWIARRREHRAWVKSLKIVAW